MEADAEDINEENRPNNNFGQYTLDDLLRHEDNMNVAMVQGRRKKEAWDAIKTLNGTQVTRKTKTYGNITWTVVDGVYDDKYEQIVQEERKWLEKNLLLKNV